MNFDNMYFDGFSLNSLIDEHYRINVKSHSFTQDLKNKHTAEAEKRLHSKKLTLTRANRAKGF
jgi:hypothetical protein